MELVDVRRENIFYYRMPSYCSRRERPIPMKRRKGEGTRQRRVIDDSCGVVANCVCKCCHTVSVRVSQTSELLPTCRVSSVRTRTSTSHRFLPSPHRLALSYHHEIISKSSAQLLSIHRICHSAVLFCRMVPRPEGEACRQFSAVAFYYGTRICCDPIRYRKLILGQAPYLQTCRSIVQLFGIEHLPALE